MKLFSFLQTLFSEGSVTVNGHLSAFDEDDLEDSLQLLRGYYEEDIIHMPSVAPAFSEAATAWAAKHLYLSLQLTVLSDVSTAVINENLKPFDGELTPENIYSADLVLRYVPDVFNLAKGLAPADIMVTKMIETAVQWPFSSVGMQLEQDVDDTVILSHPSLRIAYTDRIIKTKDIKRVTNDNIRESVMEALGNYASVLWPDFYELTTNIKTCNPTIITTTL